MSVLEPQHQGSKRMMSFCPTRDLSLRKQRLHHPALLWSSQLVASPCLRPSSFHLSFKGGTPSSIAPGRLSCCPAVLPVSFLTVCFFLQLNCSFRKWNNVWIKPDDIWQFYEVGYVEMSCGKKSIKKECVPLWGLKGDLKPLDDFQTLLITAGEAGGEMQEDCFFPFQTSDEN